MSAEILGSREMMAEKSRLVRDGRFERMVERRSEVLVSQR